MPKVPSVAVTLATSFVANAAALAVAFGVELSQTQITTMLAFVGSTTTIATVIVAALHAHATTKAVTLITSPSSGNGTRPAPPPAGGGA